MTKKEMEKKQLCTCPQCRRDRKQYQPINATKKKVVDVLTGYGLEVFTCVHNTWPKNLTLKFVIHEPFHARATREINGITKELEYMFPGCKPRLSAYLEAVKNGIRPHGGRSFQLFAGIIITIKKADYFS